MENDTTAEGSKTVATTKGDDTNAEGEREQEALADHSEIGDEGYDEEQGGHVEREQMKGEHDDQENMLGEGDELTREQMEGERGEGKEGENKEVVDERVEEEEQEYVEEPPLDPAAPFDFSDSKEALKPPFQLRADQLAEVDALWALYQDYNPAYTDIDNYITEKELVYMLKCLFLMTYTPEQLLELVAYCVKPPHPDGHISYEQFVKMVTIRQRDFLVEDELRTALRVYEIGKTGMMDRQHFKETLANEGHKMPPKLLDNLLKEVDISGDGTIGIEDCVGTMIVDLNEEDMQMLRDTLNPPPVVATKDEDDF